jgi:hypothetical protein
MERNIAIVIAGGLIALAIMITNHWTINTLANGLTAAARLNRWTGEIELCSVEVKTLSGFNVSGAKLECGK